MVITFLGTIMFALMTSYIFAVQATEMGLPSLVTTAICFAIGFFLPKFLMKQMYPELYPEKKDDSEEK